MLNRTHCDLIERGDSVVVGLGDSFTQGTGAYSLETWQSIPSTANPATYNINGEYFIEESGANNWVRQLANRLGYKTWNCGVNGSGNRASFRELVMNPLPNDTKNVVVILMSTGIERYDFLKQKIHNTGENWHYKWQTVFPTISDRGEISKLENEYYKQIYSPKSTALEFLFTVSDIQNYCIARNYKFMLCSAFDSLVDRKKIINELDDRPNYIDIVDWNSVYHPDNCTTFTELLVKMEGHAYTNMYELQKRLSKMKIPSKYMTPCSHWSIEGHSIVAERLYLEMEQRLLV